MPSPVALSPLSPLGPARTVDPDKGLAADWTVLALGAAVLVRRARALAVAIAVRVRPTTANKIAGSRARTSRVANAAAASGLPAAAVTGLRFALEPGRGRTSVPVRSALTGRRPGRGHGDRDPHVRVRTPHARQPARVVRLELDPRAHVGQRGAAAKRRVSSSSDAQVEAWSGYTDTNAVVDGQTIAILFSDADAAVAPPILSGHALQADDEIVLGAATLAGLHKHVGDTVSAASGAPADAPFYLPPTPLDDRRYCDDAGGRRFGTASPTTRRWGPARSCPTQVAPDTFRQALVESGPDAVGTSAGVRPVAQRHLGRGRRRRHATHRRRRQRGVRRGSAGSR